MKVITERDMILDVVKRWEEQYSGESHPTKQRILAKLKKLDLTQTTAKQIESIIGNDSWTVQICTECRKKVPIIIQLGEKPDWESKTVYLCENCLTLAYNTLRARTLT
jgi:hypothetical protein